MYIEIGGKPLAEMLINVENFSKGKKQVENFLKFSTQFRHSGIKPL